MIYSIIKWLSQITLKAYFHKVVVRGVENIPSQGPVIIVANHPSAFMDPMVIGMITKRSLHFIAAAEFMGRGFRLWIYRKLLHMIPVYRPNLPDDRQVQTNANPADNKGMFEQCFQLLGLGGALLIFPEGSSVTEKRIRKLKSGTARIALGARDHLSNGTEVSIVPVGLNYSNPHRFQSELFVNVGEPVTTKGYDSGLEGVVSLTAEIERRLRETVVHVEYEELDSVVKKVELIMKSGPRGKQYNEKLQAQQQFVQSINTMHEEQPEVIQQLEMKLDEYLDKIRRMGVSDRSVASLSPLNTPTERLRLYAGRPLFIVGFLINALPYYGTIFFFRLLNLFPREAVPGPRQNLNPAFHGSIAISIGMVVFINWYMGLAAVIGITVGIWWIGIIAAVVFYLTGLFTLRYIGWTLIADQKSRIRKLLGRGTEFYADLIVERREILESINRMSQRISNQIAS